MNIVQIKISKRSMPKIEKININLNNLMKLIINLRSTISWMNSGLFHKSKNSLLFLNFFISLDISCLEEKEFWAETIKMR